MKHKVFIVLSLIVILAFFLRINNVTKIPPSLNWDEVSIGYNAYSILKTGKDEWNMFLPVHFKAYGEYKLPVQIYASIPGIYIFGLNELGVRITPVIYGTLTVLIMFFLGKVLFESVLAGLVSAFLLAISPWHIHLTRASFESSFATFFVTLGILFLVKGFKQEKWLIFSMVPFAISVFTYNSARIFSPFFLLVILIIYRKSLLKFKKIIFISFTVFFILLTPLFPFLFSGERSARYKLVSITDDPGLVLRINENRGNSKLPFPLQRVIHNKVTYVALYFTKNYITHFTPQFLFFTGALHKQHHVQNIGELYLFQAPFLLLGLYALFRSRNRFKGLLLSWLFLAYIPVSITNDSIPHALRTLIAVPFYQIISASGFVFSLKWLKKFSRFWKIILGLGLAVILIVSLSYYLYQYYFVYPKAYSKDWQYGYKQAVDFVNKHSNEYDRIIFSRHYGEPHMFSLFYLNYDPTKYQNNPDLVRYETNDWVWVLKFDKFYFPDLGDKGTTYQEIVKANSDKKLLFIGTSADFPKEIPRIFSIDFLNGKNAFEIVEKK